MKKEQLTIVKTGGKVLENELYSKQFLKSFLTIRGKKILVHGGGVLADRLLKKQGLEPVMENGRRVTDSETLDTVIMAYGGLVNKKLVAGLAAEGVSSVGITGADGLTVQSVKRPVRTVDYGFAGDVIAVEMSLIDALLSAGHIPVIAPLSISREGQILNTNADTMAARIALACADTYQVRLVYAFEINGVMADINEPSSLITSLSKDNYKQLKKDGTITAGMIPKLDNAFEATAKTEKTIITHFSNVGAALAGKNSHFTEILKD